MKIKYVKYLAVLFFSFFTLTGFSQTEKKHRGPYLFADREHCISGDTVWYKAAHQTGSETQGNIIRVQLTDASGRLITSAAKKSDGGWAEGYIYVPDSLSSGVYFLTAFFSGQRIVEGQYIQKRSLFVYNRFQKMLSEFWVPSVNNIQQEGEHASGVQIIPVKTVYKPREQVAADIKLQSLSSAGINQAIIKAEYLDDFAAEAGGNFYVESVAPADKVPDFKEADGILISGKVTDHDTGNSGKNVLVLFSLLNDPQYFDYCITDSNGLFHFFLKNAIGIGEVVLQAFSESGEDWEVSLETFKMNEKEPIILEERQLTTRQIEFIEETVDAAFFSRLFGKVYAPGLTEFKMTPRFEMPFYGYPYKRIVLSEFIELPDFQEISRELLHGVQYRQNGNEITLRMLNLQANVYFEDQPFRLINGIPVFQNRLFSPLGSNEIDYIDYVVEDRIFGDLRFNGVLAVYLKDRTNGWMARQPNLFRYNVPLLQDDAVPSHLNPPTEEMNLPDLRRVFYWQLHKTDKPVQIEFLLSDIKGKVRITVEGVTVDGEIFNASEIIEVQ